MNTRDLIPAATLLSVICLFGAPSLSSACGSYGKLWETITIPQLIDENEDVRNHAIARLRGEGQEGLDLAMLGHAALLSRGDNGELKDHERVEYERLIIALTRISGQRNGHLSRLYWHTEIDKAKTMSAASGKPILSLRLLGKLTDEYSCANSRFFRTALYTNKDVSAYLRSHFVLHWQSVRPIPVVKVDFGDGRVIERTITGNSAHLVLNADGRVVDALPGLYGPKMFMEILGGMHTIATQLNRESNDKQSKQVASYHVATLEDVLARWEQELDSLQPVATAQPAVHAWSVIDVKPQVKAPPAPKAAFRAMTKAVVEQPMLEKIHFAQNNNNVNIIADMNAVPSSGDRIDDLDRRTSKKFWDALADNNLPHAHLDAASRSLIRCENPSEAASGEGLEIMIARFEKSMALDMVRNEYQLHTRIHEKLAETPLMAADTFTAWVYDKLFLTPDSDPWLGLVPDNTYTGLEQGGLQNSRQAASNL